MKLNIKDLFIKSDEQTNDNQTANSSPSITKFPVSDMSNTTHVDNIFTQVTNTTTSIPDEILKKTIDSYSNGFDSLNQNGYDFYEFYKAIIQAGIDNSQAYNLAFTMVSAMDKSVTKDKLIQSADYYLNEINNVYTNNLNKGNTKRQEILNQKSNEKETLNSELSSMVQQLEALKIQIEGRKTKLNLVDNKYESVLKDIDYKISANEIAKNQLIDSLQKAKSGIINNIK